MLFQQRKCFTVEIYLLFFIYTMFIYSFKKKKQKKDFTPNLNTTNN